MSNYPDDVRNFDDDPRSPFYDGPEDDQDYCEKCDLHKVECECKDGDCEECGFDHDYCECEQ